MADVIKKPLVKEEPMEPINLDDRIEIELTDKAFSVKKGTAKKGDVRKLHPKQAESWIASGKAIKAKGGK
jgi:hypothetical protein